jgi:hypothetical protein
MEGTVSGSVQILTDPEGQKVTDPMDPDLTYG